MNNYDDIINLPHPTSPTRPRMSLRQRAAQFAPFAALTGFEEAIARSRQQNLSRFRSDNSLPIPG